VAFLLALLANQALTIALALKATAPEIPHWMDQRYLVLLACGFPVLAVWGFNARWLPVFLGLQRASSPLLYGALVTLCAALVAAFAGNFLVTAILLALASLVAAAALKVFLRARKPAKTLGISRSFPYFVRGAYIWLLVAAGLSVYAALADVNGGIWGASRHSLTVGFLATMVFAIGQRLLPAFCGTRVLYSPRLMFCSLAVLNFGCLLRVVSEVPAYEAGITLAWRILPVSAIFELTAVTLFALNLIVTFLLPPPRPPVRIAS